MSIFGRPAPPAEQPAPPSALQRSRPHRDARGSWTSWVQEPAQTRAQLAGLGGVIIGRLNHHFVGLLEGDRPLQRPDQDRASPAGRRRQRRDGPDESASADGRSSQRLRQAAMNHPGTPGGLRTEALERWPDCSHRSTFVSLTVVPVVQLIGSSTSTDVQAGCAAAKIRGGCQLASASVDSGQAPLPGATTAPRGELSRAAGQGPDRWSCGTSHSGRWRTRRGRCPQGELALLPAQR